MILNTPPNKQLHCTSVVLLMMMFIIISFITIIIFRCRKAQEAWLSHTSVLTLCVLFLQSSQSLWNRLSVLLNLLPSAADLQESGTGEGRGHVAFEPTCSSGISMCVMDPVAGDLPLAV